MYQFGLYKANNSNYFAVPDQTRMRAVDKTTSFPGSLILPSPWSDGGETPLLAHPRGVRENICNLLLVFQRAVQVIIPLL